MSHTLFIPALSKIQVGRSRSGDLQHWSLVTSWMLLLSPAVPPLRPSLKMILSKYIYLASTEITPCGAWWWSQSQQGDFDASPSLESLCPSATH